MQSRAFERKRIGIVSTDPLRVVGLQAILEDGAATSRAQFEVISLATPNSLRTPGLHIVLIDGGASDHLLHLIASFRRDRPKLRLLVMGPNADQQQIERVIAGGARGYLSHSASEEEILQAVEAVSEGSVWASRSILTRLLDRPAATFISSAIHEVPRFTRREREVLGLLARGYPNREIGKALGVDEGTIKAHVGRLMRKMGVVNRTALTMLSLERRLC